MNITHHPPINGNNCQFLFPDRAFPKNVIDLFNSSSHQNNPFLNLVIKDLISICVDKICIDSNSYLFPFINSSDLIDKEQIYMIDLDLVSTNNLGFILTPFLNQINLEIQTNGSKISYISSSNQEVPQSIIVALFRSYSPLRKFLLGIENQIFIDIDLPTLYRDVYLMYTFSESQKAKDNFLVLLELFNNYKEISIQSFQPKTCNYEKYLTIFHEISQDKIYKDMSRYSFSWGVSQLIDESIIKFENLASNFLSDRSDLESKQIQLMIGKQFSNVKLKTELDFLKNSYLPPIISVNESILQAITIWNSTCPDLAIVAENYTKTHWENNYWS